MSSSVKADVEKGRTEEGENGIDPPIKPNLAVDQQASAVDSRSSLQPTSSPTQRLKGQAIAVLIKDLKSELRNRAAINAILLFSVTALVIVAFSAGQAALVPLTKAALIWIILFFAAFSGLAHVFIHEEETGTSMALRLTTPAGAVYTGKLLFNLALMGAITALVVPLFMLMLEMRPANTLAFLAVFLAGAVDLGAAATIVAAIIAKARGKGALYGALGFPILLPLLFMLVDATSLTMQADASSMAIFRDIVGLVAFAVMLITASAMLFPVIWEE